MIDQSEMMISNTFGCLAWTPPESFCRDHSMNDRIVFNWVEATTSNRECGFTLYSELKAKSLTAGEFGDVFFFHVMVSSNHSNLESASNLRNPSIFFKNGSGATHVQALGALGP